MGLEISQNLAVKKNLVNATGALDEEMGSRRVCLSQIYKLLKTYPLSIVKMPVRLLVFCLLFVQIVCKLVIKQIVCPPVRPVIPEGG